MDFNMMLSCAALFVVVAIVFAIARFFLKLTTKIISIIITFIVAIGLLAILYFFVF